MISVSAGKFVCRKINGVWVVNTPRYAQYYPFYLQPIYIFNQFSHMCTWLRTWVVNIAGFVDRLGTE